MISSPTAVLLLNFGGPASLDDVEPYLYNLFSDGDLIQLPLGFLWQKQFAKRISRARAADSRAIYAAIGGRSPILDHTNAQASAVAELLGPDFRTYVAMRAWEPYIDDVVDRLLEDGAKEVVALPLYPQRSRTTSGSSMRELRRVLKKKAPSLPVFEVCCFPEAPGFIDAWLEKIRPVYEGIAAERRGSAHVLFSAHGLPQKVIDRGDPYLTQVQTSVRAVMAGLPAGLSHSLSFQSRATRAKWLEPATEDELARLASQGVKDVIVVPIAFVTEHVETLYELDMLLKEPAVAAGIDGYHRVDAPGTAPKLMEELAGLVRRAHAGDGAPLCSAPEGVRCPRIR